MAEPLPTLPDLRRMLTPGHLRDAAHRLALGIPMIDDVLGGGLPLGAVHELHPCRPLDHGAVSGFAGALAALARDQAKWKPVSPDHAPNFSVGARTADKSTQSAHARLLSAKPDSTFADRALHNNKSGKQIVWIQHDYAAMEVGALYGAEFFGLPLSSLVVVHVPRVIDALWALEEALKCRAVDAVIAEIAEEGAVDLTTTRRLALAARDGGGLGLLLHHRPSATSSASATRWEIASAPGVRDAFGGLGRTTFALSLIKNRCGPCGCWTLAWNHHERAFFIPALPLGVAQTARDRSARALSARAA